MLPWPTMKAFRWTGRARAPKACAPEFAVPPELPGTPRRFEVGPDETRTAGVDAVYGGLTEIQAFCSAIPEPIRRAVAAFRERHWQLLTWLATGGPAAEQLLAANPALAFAVACGAELTVWEAPIEFLAKQSRMAYRSQIGLLGTLGFPATERVRRIVRKIVPGAVTLERMLRLREWVRDDGIVSRLAHTPSLNSAVFTLLENGTFASMTDAALQQVACAQEDEATDLAGRFEEAVRLWGLVRPTTPLPQFNQAERIREVLAELRTDLTKVRRGIGLFPSAPVRGNAHIVHIDSMAMLVEESRLQSNCVDTYVRSIKNRMMAVYRVWAPQRCTLALNWRRGRWVIGELKGTANTTASTETRAAIRSWLKNATAPGVKDVVRTGPPNGRR